MGNKTVESVIEKTNFGIRLVCAKRLMDITLQTKVMTKAEMENIIVSISNEESIEIPLGRNVKIQSEQYSNDTFVIAKSLVRDLDYVTYGVWEGFEVE